MTNSPQHQAEILQDRYALKVAARLSDGVDGLPHNVSERLRAAREQALAHRKVVRVKTAMAASAQGRSATLTMGDEPMGLWGRFASAMPVISLVCGLVVVNIVQNDRRALELAEVDAALLTDDLPPAAYTDPGFLQFLKSPAGQPASRE